MAHKSVSFNLLLSPKIFNFQPLKISFKRKSVDSDEWQIVKKAPKLSSASSPLKISFKRKAVGSEEWKIVQKAPTHSNPSPDKALDLETAT